MPPDNGPLHVEYNVTRKGMASATEAELGGLFENCQEAASIRTDRTEMYHLQPPKQVATDNTAANSKVNRTEKQKDIEQ